MTKLGQYITSNYRGMKLTYIAEQSGMTKQRLHILMYSEAAKITLLEACRLSQVLSIGVEELCRRLYHDGEEQA